MQIPASSLLALVTKLVDREKEVTARRETEVTPSERLCLTVEATVLARVSSEILELVKGSFDVPA